MPETDNFADVDLEDKDEVGSVFDEAMDGGEGSGNFNHSGRPGKIGGSGEGSTAENIVDLSGRFTKAPNIDEVRSYINEVVEKGTKFATLSPDWLVDVKGGRKKKDHLIYSSKVNDMSSAEKRRHNQYVMTLEDILSKATYTGSETNKKIDKKPNIEKYHYFTTLVKFGDTKYKLSFVAEQYKGEKEDKPQTVHLYDVFEVK